MRGAGIGPYFEVSPNVEYMGTTVNVRSYSASFAETDIKLIFWHQLQIIGSARSNCRVFEGFHVPEW